MLLTFQSVLTPSELAEIRTLLGSAQWLDGALSGKATLKQNLQTAQGNPGLEKATQKVVQCLMSRDGFKAYAVPRQVTVVFNRYDQGMFYKDHMDAALMGGLHRQPLRSDISFTSSQ